MIPPPNVMNPMTYMPSMGGNGFSQIKNQLITMLLLKTNDNKEGTNNGMLGIIYGYILLFLIEEFFRVIPVIFSEIRAIVRFYFIKKTNTLNAISNFGNENKSSVEFEKKLSETNLNIVDALIDKMVQTSNSKFIKYTSGRYIVNHSNKFKVDEDVYAKMKGTSSNEKGMLDTIVVEFSSDELTLEELQVRLDDYSKYYFMNLQNKLGNTIYHFNEIIMAEQKGLDGRKMSANPIPFIIFSKHPFYTNRTLNNIYGPEIEIVRKRLDFFLNNRKWYEQKGIPYTFGLLLHGQPGCGKTSIIKAISKMSNRHIFNITFNRNLTKKQLENLFFDDKVYVSFDDGKKETYTIPIEKRIYVIEDIDCGDNDVVFKREDKFASSVVINQELPSDLFLNSTEEDMGSMCPYKPSEIPSKKKVEKEEENPDKVTLSFLLNLIDGILETPGRIIIMTSNFPERLDKAFIRPGRVDLILNFNRCTRHTLIEIIENFYDISLNAKQKERINDIGDYVITPAKANQILFANFGNVDNAILELCNTSDN